MHTSSIRQGRESKTKANVEEFFMQKHLNHKLIWVLLSLPTSSNTGSWDSNSLIAAQVTC